MWRGACRPAALRRHNPFLGEGPVAPGDRLYVPSSVAEDMHIVMTDLHLLRASEKRIRDELGLAGSGQRLNIDLEWTDGERASRGNVFSPPDGTGNWVNQAATALAAWWHGAPAGAARPPVLALAMDWRDFHAETAKSASDIQHEVTHAVMIDALGGVGRLPVWFHEGMAVAMAAQGDKMLADDATGHAHPERIIDRAGDIAEHWNGDYASAYVAVRYLHHEVKRQGGAGVRDVLQHLREHPQASLDDAIRAATRGVHADVRSLFASFTNERADVGRDFVRQHVRLDNEDGGGFGGIDAGDGAVPVTPSTVTRLALRIKNADLSFDGPMDHFDVHFSPQGHRP